MSVRIPAVGDVLTHKFRKRVGEVRAEVIGVDETTGRVAVRVNGKDYASLSAAANAVAGTTQNGWIYWGLKKQTPYRRRG